MRNGAARITVAQLGARRHYAVPIALARAGILHRFHTDLYLRADWLRSLVARCDKTWPRGSFRAVLNRHSRELEPRIVRSHLALAAQATFRSRSIRSQSDRTALWIWKGARFCRAIVRAGLEGATGVYAYSSAALELFTAAREQGVACYLDQATAPKTLEDTIVREARSRYPPWFADEEQDRWTASYTERQLAEMRSADRIICNSSYVRRLVADAGAEVDKAVVVPLGVSLAVPHQPVHGGRKGGSLRMLFVGDDGLRKGLADLLSATSALGLQPSDIRVIGALNLSQQGLIEIPKLCTVLGRVPRDEMAAHYRWADVLVLPSVSDTFGLVVLEAMAHGLPAIVTRNTGAADIIDDGDNGFILPVHSPESIAECLEKLAQDRSLLSAMAEGATEAAREYSLDQYARRLVRTLCVQATDNPMVDWAEKA